MSLDLDALRAACAQGSVVRVLILRAAGSVPREAGTAMLVRADAAKGTIGGGALEHLAIAEARAVLTKGQPRLLTLPLGPALGQCCGGSVTLLWERFDSTCLPVGLPYARALPAADSSPAGAIPAAVTARRAAMRPGDLPETVAGWIVEAAPAPRRPVWIWGAGHVGRAIAAMLAPLPDFEVTLIDTALDRLPDPVPPQVTPIVAADPVVLVPHAPVQADHLVLTYSHRLDLALCDALLRHGFGSCGLIGSATKWARFRGRLAELGHRPAEIAGIACPIGDPGLGRHPQAIALGVCSALVSRSGVSADRKERAG